MPVELEYILRRNKSNLKSFIIKNKLTSYQLLLEYCERRKFTPCNLSEYEKAYKLIDSGKKVKSEAKNANESTEAVKTKRRTVSETQKPKKRRYRRKKQQDTPKLPNSADKG